MKRKPRNRPNKPYFRLNKLLLFLFILFLPTQLGKHFFLPFSYLSGIRVDYLAPTIYLTDIIVILLAVINFKTVVPFFMTRKLLVVLGLLLLNTLFAQSPPISIYHYLKIIELLTVFAVFSKTKIGEKIILLGFLIGGVAQLTLSLLQLVNKQSLQGIFYFLGERYFTLGTPGIAKASFGGVEFLRPYATFSHPNSLAGFYLLLYFFVLTNKKFNKFFYLKYLSLFIFSGLVFISFSKVAIISYLILNIIYILSSRSKNSCGPCLVARVLVLLITSFIFFQAMNDPLTINKRVELVKNSIRIISQHPILGVGLGNYLFAQNQFVSKYFLFFNQPVHNIFLLFFAEVGLLLAAYILYQLFIVFKKLPASIPSTSLGTSFYLLSSILLTGMFDHYWLTLQQNFLLMGVVLGLKFL